MKTIGLLFGVMAAALPAAVRVDELFDRAGEALTFADAGGTYRARISGAVELEAFFPSEPVSDLVFSDRDAFLNPRLTVFLDAQLGPRWYLFAQARVDRRFDPADTGDLRPRLDELALRFTPWADGRFNLQVGQFATVLGQWARRHTAWENPFITAPLPYDNLTAIWDRAAATSSATLLSWAHVEPVSDAAGVHADKKLRLPIVWGPSYTTGVAVSGASGHFEYALELKNATPSSRPKVWNDHGDLWEHPTVTARVGWSPSPTWSFGLSTSSGTYLLPLARDSLPPGAHLGDYRQLLLAQDVSFAWRHWQIWGEIHAARFEVPRVGDADTLAYFVEAKYKFTPQWSAALRWNQQTFDQIEAMDGRQVRWGREVWRVDFGPTYRFTPHIQLKVQLSLRHENPAATRYTHSVATQLTARF